MHLHLSIRRQRQMCIRDRDNVYQILSESSGLCGRYDKNILVCFLVHSVHMQNTQVCRILICVVPDCTVSILSVVERLGVTDRQTNTQVILYLSVQCHQTMNTQRSSRCTQHRVTVHTTSLCSNFSSSRMVARRFCCSTV